MLATMTSSSFPVFAFAFANRVLEKERERARRKLRRIAA